MISSLKRATKVQFSKLYFVCSFHLFSNQRKNINSWETIENPGVWFSTVCLFAKKTVNKTTNSKTPWYLGDGYLSCENTPLVSHVVIFQQPTPVQAKLVQRARPKLRKRASAVFGGRTWRCILFKFSSLSLLFILL